MFADTPDEEEFPLGKQWCEIILTAMRKLMDYKNVQVQRRNIQKMDWEEYLKWKEIAYFIMFILKWKLQLKLMMYNYI